MILCKFGQICVTGNALAYLEMILCQFGWICATWNALMRLETILCEFEWICATGNTLMQLETILCEFGRIYATGDALMQQETILCEFGRICATWNAFEWLTVGRNSILNFPAKTKTGMCRALVCGDWWWLITQQGQSRKRLLLASRGHPARTPAYQGSCINPTYLPHTLDLTPDLPFSITHITTQLLIKDKLVLFTKLNELAILPPKEGEKMR